METNTTVTTRQSIKLDFLDNLEGYDLKDSKYPEDIINEVSDGLVPVYNNDLINFASNYQGEEFWLMWLEESWGDSPLDMLRYNVYQLIQMVGMEVLEELQAEWVEDK